MARGGEGEEGSEERGIGGGEKEEEEEEKGEGEEGEEEEEGFAPLCSLPPPTSARR